MQYLILAFVITPAVELYLLIKFLQKTEFLGFGMAFTIYGWEVEK